MKREEEEEEWGKQAAAAPSSAPAPHWECARPAAPPPGLLLSAKTAAFDAHSLAFSAGISSLGAGGRS